jgi:hypothetical protein
MRRTLIVLIGAALALTGCGSSSSSSPNTNPVTAELSYFPTGTPFVLTLATDPNAGSVHSAQALLNRFPEAGLGIDVLEQRLSAIGLSYSGDIRPLFGNPIALGTTSTSGVSTAGAKNNFLAVWVTKDAGKLNELITKLLHGTGSLGKRDGASLYQLGPVALAVDGATAVIGTSDSVTAALDRHAHGGGFTQAELSQDTAGLPRDTLMEAFGSLTGVLSGPNAAKARMVPWVGAIRGYGAAISVTSSGITFQYRVNTSGGSLSSSQIPFAAGAAAPSIATGAPIAVALHNPAQVISFAEAVDRVTNPADYAKFQKRQATLKRKTGVDLNTLLGLLSGDLIINSDTHTTVGRAGVSDGAAAAKALKSLATAPQGLFKTGTTITPAGGGFYSVHEPPATTLTVGVVGNQVVAGKATVAQLKTFASAPASAASFAHGSFAFQIALQNLLRIVMKGGQQSAVVQTVLQHLGNVTGWAGASTGALTGAATLAVK